MFKLQINDRIEVQPITGPPVQCKVIRVEPRAIGFAYRVIGDEPGKRREMDVVGGVDGKWYEKDETD